MSRVHAGSYERRTVAEYFALEKDSDQRHEFIDGRIVPMATETLAHSIIVSNANAAIHAATRSKTDPRCRPLSPNMQLRYGKRRRYGYGDTAVVCGEPRFEKTDPNQITLMNPTLIVEVLSYSTEAYNRREKFGYYCEIETFREYVLIEQHAPRIETMLRQPDGTWRIAYFEGLDARIPLFSIDVELFARDVYADVIFADDEIDDA